MPFTVGGDWVSPSENTPNRKRVVVHKQKRKGRWITLIHPIESHTSKVLLKELKSLCHCGGSLKEETIELQGDQEEKVKKILQQKKML